MEDYFDLSILDTGDPSRAIAVARSGCDLAIEALSCLPLKTLIAFRSRLMNAAGGVDKRPTISNLQDFGHDLFDFLVRADVQRIYTRLPNSHIRFQIYSNRADLQAIPWEYIQQRDTVPGPNSFRSIVRIIPTIGLPAPEVKRLSEAVRMLFVHAEPILEQSVRWLDIKESIESEFRARLPERFEIDVIDGVSSDSFMKAFDGKRYDILHFTGHGEIGSNGEGSLLFQDRKTKKKEPISASQLGMFIKDKELRLVVLGACNSSAGDFAKEFAVVAKTLVQTGIPAVVANQFPITNSIAATFAGAFYKELLNSGDVDLATTRGRLSLAFGPNLPADAARIEWGIPTLYRHIGAARAFKA
jgi:hypothetical protein